MPAPINRCSISTSAVDLLLIKELADLTGQSISAVASRAVSEWLVEHYEERREFYLNAVDFRLKNHDAVGHFRPAQDHEEGRSQRLCDATGGDAARDDDFVGDLSSGFQSRIRSMEAAHTSRVSKDGG